MPGTYGILQIVAHTIQLSAVASSDRLGASDIRAQWPLISLATSSSSILSERFEHPLGQGHGNTDVGKFHSRCV